MSLTRRDAICGLAAAPLCACDKPDGPVQPWRPRLEWRAPSRQILLDGAPLEAVKLWDFAGGPAGFTAEGGALSRRAGDGVVLRADTGDAKLRSPGDLAVPGIQANLVAVSLVRLRTAGAWDGALYYVTDRHGESARFMNLPTEAPPPESADAVLAYDMAAPQMGGRDWMGAVIRQIRWDAEAAAGGEVLVRQIVMARRPLEAPGP
ncbi:hypothetical protein [Phenylobacterium sp.]|uniref:hypothetical protein n=1 Tax=Phenylobacterium sp. TaxID=1871053 RepID=UPI0019C46AAC|nr:hypothetical protein [Phenylobacterium sp.]MBC7166631.1 hypothetical protein [Phenylobacterium sp.]